MTLLKRRVVEEMKRLEERVMKMVEVAEMKGVTKREEEEAEMKGVMKREEEAEETRD
jgi:hypothetical protein